jgi:hypothetical protein
MAGIGGAHVRAATAFLGSERFLRYSPAAQALWTQLHRIAVELKREFLPEEYTPAAIARAWGQPVDLVKSALHELANTKRPIINTLDVQFGEDDPVTLVRVRGAREKQPVGWKDESDLARLWNEANPEDLVEVEAFSQVRVNRRTEEGGSQPGATKRSSQTSRKRTASAKQSQSKRGKVAPQKAGDVLADAARLPDRREEKTRENSDLQSKPPADPSPPLPTGASTAGGKDSGNGLDPRLTSRFDKLTVGWGTPPDDPTKGRKRALLFLGADAARLLSHVLEIDSDVQKYKDAWAELTRRLVKFEMPRDEKYYDRAKKLVRAVTSE